jgi:hypothetical protein
VTEGEAPGAETRAPLAEVRLQSTAKDDLTEWGAGVCANACLDGLKNELLRAETQAREPAEQCRQTKVC